jgi:aminoglycoside 3-N-acetyltransferase
MLVHSSLSSCGHFIGGPSGVLDVLAEVCGTLSFVTHSYCYPQSLGELGPIFDAKATPSQNGALTNIFRMRPQVVRSIHATHSVAALGPLANEFTAGHYRCDSPSGPGTPYRRLIALQGSVLFFGVTYYCYTLFHTAEIESGSNEAFDPGLVDRLRVIDEMGAVRECASKRQNRALGRFAKAGELLELKGLARKVKLGRDHLRFIPDTAKAHDFLVERLRKIPDFLRLHCKIDMH